MATITPLPTTQLSSEDFLAALNAPSGAQAPDTQLGQEDFLRLLTTQLQNQDPTDPVDAKDMITDLTGFNQLEATLKLNETMAEAVQGFTNLQTMQAANLIGKSVKVEGEMLEHTSGAQEQIKLVSEQSLQDVRLIVSDDAGPVREIFVGTVSAGEQIATWDGLDELGQAVSSGEYKLTAYGVDANGDIASLTTIVPTRVSSVAIQPGGLLQLTLATGEVVNMDSVREISE